MNQSISIDTKATRLGGSFVFIVSFVVYYLTLAPTVSFWDCGEFISCANGMQVGHAPGAPVYLMLAKAMSLFAMPQHIAFSINLFSAFASALTIYLLFASLMLLFHKLPGNTNNWINLVAAGIGSLTFAFTDSFWFSAVEAEVYALSLFFTAFTLWAVLKWELEFPKPTANRWLLLIVFCLGLSVGVHLLNLLSIPVVVFWVYIHIKPSQKYRHIIGLAIGIMLLLIIQFVIIENGLFLAKQLELLLVNVFQWPVHSGLILYSLILFGLLGIGIVFTRKRNSLVHFGLLAIMLFFIGLSSYALVIIRANAQPGINLNNPTQVYSLASFLNREQYGQRPLLKGAWFGAERASIGSTFNYRLNNSCKYERYDNGAKIVYHDKDVAWLQRMYSSQEHHINAYQYWAQLEEGEKPSIGHQLDYLFKYQLGHMYLRYFMWNFSGRQNHYQGNGDFLNGNFVTGFSFLDKYNLGSRRYKHANELTSRANNRYFMLPFIFGLLGILYLLRKKQWEILILIGSLFFLTGVAIAFYLNQPPMEPRERDYVFVGSFYAFTLFIGFAIWAVLNKVLLMSESRLTTALVVCVLVLGLPGILLANNYNDHDRSDRTLALDLAKSYLNSCEPNAILFSYGDNDTYPLWYIQEVEEFRKDIRVINLGLLSADWYVQQQTYSQKGCKPLNYTIPLDRYKRGDLDYVAIFERDISINTLKSALKFVGDASIMTQLQTKGERNLNFIPQKELVLNGDSMIQVKFEKNYLMKGELAFLDLVSTNYQQRPIYFTNGTPKSVMLGLDKNVQAQGMVSKMIAGNTRLSDEQLYNYLIDKINISLPEKSWWDETGDNAWRLTQLHTMGVQLAKKLKEKGESDLAVVLLKKYYPIQMTSINTTYKSSHEWINTLYDCGLKEEARTCLDKVREISIQNLNFYIDSEQYLGTNMILYAEEEKSFLNQLEKIEIRFNEYLNSN